MLKTNISVDNIIANALMNTEDSISNKKETRDNHTYGTLAFFNFTRQKFMHMITEANRTGKIQNNSQNFCDSVSKYSNDIDLKMGIPIKLKQRSPEKK
jgi:hypothetical protein